MYEYEYEMMTFANALQKAALSSSPTRFVARLNDGRLFTVTIVWGSHPDCIIAGRVYQPAEGGR